MIGIIDYATGNIRSVQNALERIGTPCVLTDKKSVLNTCEKIIFPGVGSAQTAMKNLEEKNLIPWIKNCPKPFLGICLGMQLLFEFSEENNTDCLGIIPGKVQKFIPTKNIPHMGWNQIESTKLKRFDQKYVYFVHSYFAPENEWTLATTQYEDDIFSALIRKNNFWGMQFHPEKSGTVGQELLSLFINNEE